MAPSRRINYPLQGRHSTQNFPRPRMAPPRTITMVTLPHGNRLPLRGGRQSVRVLVQLLVSRGYSVGVRLAPLNVLSLVPAEDRPFLFFFRDALLTVREQAVAPVAAAPDSEESPVWVSDSDDSSVVDTDHPELG